MVRGGLITCLAFALLSCGSREADPVGGSSSRFEARRTFGSGPLPASAAPIVPLFDRSGAFAMQRLDLNALFRSRGMSLAVRGGAERRRLSATLIGARDVQPIAESPQRTRVNRYVGTASEWQSAVESYGRLVWEEVYPDVDMIVEPAREGFAYQFVLSPGAKVSDLVMRWEGAGAVRLVEQGRGVDVENDLGVLRVRGLRAFAVEGNHRVELPARFVAAGANVSLEVEGWSGRGELIIDPTVTWMAKFDHGSVEGTFGVAVDKAGNAYVTGWTDVGEAKRNRVAFVTKFGPDGAILWTTLVGGTRVDEGHDIAVDQAGNVFVTGYTSSTDFPTKGGSDTTLGGEQDCFVTKLSPDGALLWSTYLGGSGLDGGNNHGIAVDGAGNAYVTGETLSTDFPSKGGFDTTHGGGDAFITKLGADGALLWSTYLGGSAGDDVGRDIAVDRDGNAIVVGATGSSDFPITGGFDTTFAPAPSLPPFWGGGDAFITKVSADGALLWSSYLGGSGADSADGVALDAEGNAFVVGLTQSSDFPALSGFDATYGGGGCGKGTCGDAFVSKVSGAAKLLWSTYVGGAGDDQSRAIAVDACGHAVIAGRTSSQDFPTAGGFDTTFNHSFSGDGFITKVRGDGTLRWSSYLGEGTLLPQGIAVDGSGNSLVVGSALSTQQLYKIANGACEPDPVEEDRGCSCESVPRHARTSTPVLAAMLGAALLHRRRQKGLRRS